MPYGVLPRMCQTMCACKSLLEHFSLSATIRCRDAKKLQKVALLSPVVSSRLIDSLHFFATDFYCLWFLLTRARGVRTRIKRTCRFVSQSPVVEVQFVYTETYLGLGPSEVTFCVHVSVRMCVFVRVCDCVCVCVCMRVFACVFVFPHGACPAVLVHI